VSVILGSAALVAQAPVAPPAKFDVVSIKSAVDTSIRRNDWTPGRFVARSRPLIGLINQAYGGGAPVRLDGADAMRLSMWDIDATFEPQVLPTAGQAATMLRAMLEDRFHLVLRSESRDTDVYALTLVRTDGRLGPSLRPSELPCDAAGRATFGSSVPPLGQRPACAVFTSISASAVIGGDGTIEQFMRGLVPYVGRPIVDRTGLKGTFDGVLTFAMDSIPAAPGPVDPAAIPLGLPSVFTALHDQFGLRLEATRAPVQYYVVERLVPPEAN
jgi:uncharacterized protein (TIGR03435 family)